MSYPLFHPERTGDLPAFLSSDELKAEYPGEGDFIEFKTGVSPARTQEAAVAFSNAKGGVVLFGVSPDGDAVGIAQPGEKVRDIHQALRDTRNPGRYEVRELHVDDDTVLVLSVARRHEGFAQTSAGSVLIRQGASNVPLLGADLSRFLARRTFQSFELTPTEVEFQEADPELIARLSGAHGWHPEHDNIERFIEAGYAVIEGSKHVLTVAGTLLLLPEPAAVGGRPYIRIRRYRAHVPDPDRTWEIRGPVDVQVEEATDSLLSELGVMSAIVGVQRVDMPRLPPRVIREAIANAVAHRTYEHAGSSIVIDLYPTHVRIISPGELPEPVTLENIRIQQSARNERLLGALRRLGLAEDLGKGIDRMEDDMAAEVLGPPIFEDDGSFFSVTLPLEGVVTARERAWVRGLVQDGRLDGRAGIVVVTVAREGHISNSGVRSLLGVDSVEARALLQALVIQEVLIMKGERGGSTYHINPSLGIPARIRHTDSELEAIALALAAVGPLTNAALRKATGLDRQEALKVLRRLVSQGNLVQYGERRGVRYQLPRES